NPRHTYDAAGMYDVSLTVYTSYGSRTRVREAFIVVKAVSSFGTVGAAGGVITPGGVALAVAAGALEDDLVVGVNIEEAPFSPEAPDPLAALSPAYTIFHNGGEDHVYALPANGAVQPATLTFPFQPGSVPEADRNAGKIQVLCSF